MFGLLLHSRVNYNCQGLIVAFTEKATKFVVTVNESRVGYPTCSGIVGQTSGNSTDLCLVGGAVLEGGLVGDLEFGDIFVFFEMVFRKDNSSPDSDSSFLNVRCYRYFGNFMGVTDVVDRLRILKSMPIEFIPSYWGERIVSGINQAIEAVKVEIQRCEDVLAL